MSDEVVRDEPVSDSGHSDERVQVLGNGNGTPHNDAVGAMPAREESSQRLHAEHFFLASRRHDRPLLIIEPGMWIAYALVAFIAFALLGYFGYPSDMTAGYFGLPSDSILFYILYHPAWLLFVWFGAVIILIELTIFWGKAPVVNYGTSPNDTATRHVTPGDAAARRIRKWKWMIVTVTVMWMVLEAISYVWPGIFGGLPHSGPGLIAELSQGRIFWNAVNALIIAVFLVDRGVQWSTGKRTATGMTLNYPNVSQHRPITLFRIPLPRLELIAQDVFAGATLCLALGLVLQRDVLNFLFQPTHRIQVTSCAVSFVFGACQEGGAHNPMTLHNLDWIIMYFALGVSGLILVSILSVRVMYVFRDKNMPAAVVEGMLSLIYSLLLLIKSYLLNMRSVVWPLLLLPGTLALGVSARLFETYLHTLSDQRTCHAGAPCPDLREFAPYFQGQVSTEYWLTHSLPLELLLLVGTLVLGVSGIFCILLSARMLLLGQVKGPLWGNWVRFVGVTLFFIACFLWVFSIVESAFMGMFLLAGFTSRVPFPQLGISTSASFVICVIAFIVFLVRQGIQRRNPWHALRHTIKRP